MKKQHSNLSVDDLNRMYVSGESADQSTFAEMRTNVLLVAGEHYSNRTSRYWNRIRDSRTLSKEQKLRITKNHTQRIARIYTNSITNYAPGVSVVPRNAKELADQKSAELNQSVWQYLKDQNNLSEKKYQWTKDFCEIGECWAKVQWDPMVGEFIGYEQKVDLAGEPLMDGDNNMLPDMARPVFTGGFRYYRLFGFNVIRPADAQCIEDAEWLACRQMVDTQELKLRVGDDQEKLKMITSTSDSTYHVFNAGKASYETQDNKTLLIEYYFKPGPLCPNGYYYIATKEGILWSGELPFGVFPIVYAGFEDSQTTPRSASVIRTLRPYQVELNRTASKIAEVQVSALGDDKILVQNGSKVTSGMITPGLRKVGYSGAAPGILEGKSGAQYMDYHNQTLSEMYQVAQVSDFLEEKSDSTVDAYALLYKSMRNKKKFSIYAEKIERFYKQLCEISLKLARGYLDDNHLIPMIGKHEFVNIEEFRNTDPLSHQIKLEPRSDDLDSQMGKQLLINHTLQYVGSSLEKEDIGKLMRVMPFGNFEEAFSDFTIDFDSSTNMILALDRGEQVMPSRYDNGPYMIKKLVGRMRQSDFRLLDPRVQQNYQMTLQMFEDLEVKKLQEQERANAGFIPTGGFSVKCDFYVPKANDPTKTERASIPSEAIKWLMDKMNAQGSNQETLQMLGSGAQWDIAEGLNRQSGAGDEAYGQVLPMDKGLSPV